MDKYYGMRFMLNVELIKQVESEEVKQYLLTSLHYREPPIAWKEKSSLLRLDCLQAWKQLDVELVKEMLAWAELIYLSNYLEVWTPVDQKNQETLKVCQKYTLSVQEA